MARQLALSSNAVPRQNIRRAAFFRYLIWKIHLSSPHKHFGLFQTATFITLSSLLTGFDTGADPLQ